MWAAVSVVGDAPSFLFWPRVHALLLSPNFSSVSSPEFLRLQERIDLITAGVAS
jgi:hypothetical protein